jgi:hypothetical protein
MCLKKLIADSFGSDAAEAWARFSPTDEQMGAMTEATRKLLIHFPKLPGPCEVMSALFACNMEKLGLPPAYVIAGSLYVGETRVFGEDSDIDGKNRFSRSDPSWDGHAWIVWGDRLVDLSIFRATEIDPRKELFICKIEDAIRGGFRYVPQYVLTQGQVDAIAGGAIAKVREIAPR